jgi:hypothetical protein
LQKKLRLEDKALRKKRREMTKEYVKYIQRRKPKEVDEDIVNFKYPSMSGSLYMGQKMAKIIFDKSLLTVQIMELDKFVKPYILEELDMTLSRILWLH